MLMTKGSAHVLTKGQSFTENGKRRIYSASILAIFFLLQTTKFIHIIYYIIIILMSGSLFSRLGSEMSQLLKRFGKLLKPDDAMEESKHKVDFHVNEPKYVLEKQEERFSQLLKIFTSNHSPPQLTLSRLGIVSLENPLQLSPRSNEGEKLKDLQTRAADQFSHITREFCAILPILTHLKVIDLSYNRLQTVPSSISALTQLTIINLCGNHLGSVETSEHPLLPLQDLRVLVQADISYNYLQDISHIPSSVTALNAKHNRGLQYLPQDFYKLHKDLKRLNLSYCDLQNLLTTSKTPDENELAQRTVSHEVLDNIGYLEKIEYLEIDGKRKLAEIPQQLENLENLLWLSLYHQPIAELPAYFGSNSTSLTGLDLHRCLLLDLPEEFSLLENLTFLDISMNHFIDLPVSVCNLKSLTHLEASGFNWKTLPVEFENLHELTILVLRFNRFPSIPHCIFSLQNLEHLDISGNFIELLNSRPSDSFLRLENLHSLNMSHNPLTTVSV